MPAKVAPNRSSTAMRTPQQEERVKQRDAEIIRKIREVQEKNQLIKPVSVKRWWYFWKKVY